MSLDARQLRDLVVRPALECLNLWSLAAEQLVMGTAAQESRLTFLAQVGGGPALGLWQMEPATCSDIWANFLLYREPLKARVLSMLGAWPPRDQPLVTNLAYAAAMCRIHYYRDKAPLPAAGDVAAMAATWKRAFNTERGAGKVEEFVRNWQLVAGLYR